MSIVKSSLCQRNHSRFFAELCLALFLGLLAGCARFEPKPISPAQTAAELESRSLTNAALKTFLETNLHRAFPDWPATAFDFDLLTLAAFYYHPDLAVAWAQWAVAQAGNKTAGGRPNPTLSLVPGYDTAGGLASPWFPAVSLDVPIETAGKRGKRIAAAKHLSEAARLNLATVAWKVRSDLRSSLLVFSAAQRREALLEKQISVQEKIVALLDQQIQAGAIAGSEAAAPHIALQKLRLDFAAAQSQRAEARARVAEAIGVPLGALGDLPDGDSRAPGDLTTAEIRRAALQSRTDILGALAGYAAAQANLQLEIAKQYPDVHLNPGYQFDLGENKWSLGLSFDLPILNQNQGPIAEAAAHRQEAAAKFNAVQFKALAEIERTVEVFRAAEINSATLRLLADTQAKQRAAVESQFNAGALERLDWLNAQFESVNADLLQLDAQAKFQTAAAALEDAVQRPLAVMNSSAIELSRQQAKKENQP